MVGADEEMSVTVARWKLGEERLKKDIEKKEKEGACAAEAEGKPQGDEKKDIDAEIKSEVLELRKEMKKPQGKPEIKTKTPDILALMLERTIDTILLEEVANLGMKMNGYRGILAEGIMTFAEDHQEDRADLSRLIEAFRAGWKVYRVNEHTKATLDTFMEAMNNQLWVTESTCASDAVTLLLF